MIRFALAGIAALCALAFAAPTPADNAGPRYRTDRPAAGPSVSPAFGVADLRRPAGNAVGYRVYLQEWNPTKPAADTPTRVVDEPAGISGPITALWDAARAFLADPANPNSVPALLGRKNLIAKGVTLYDVKFETNPLSALDLAGPRAGVVVAGTNGSGPRPLPVTANAFSLHLHIPATRLDFRATTPDVKGIGAPRDLDPHLSAQIDLDVTLGLAVGTPGQPYLQVTDVQVLAQKPKIDSGNLAGDVLVGITDFLSNVAYGKSFNALLDQILATHNLAADPAHGGFAFGATRTYDLKAMAKDFLKPANDKIAASGATRYLRTGVWVKEQGGGRMLVGLFAPQALPLPPLSGSIAGTVQFDSTVAAGRTPASCAALVPSDRIDVEVQTGPRPVLDVDPFAYGKVPMQRLGNVALTGQPVQSGRCTYALNGLALGIPNDIVFAPPAIPTNGSLGSIGQYIRLAPANWTSPVLPLPTAANGPIPAGGSAGRRYDLVASLSTAYNPGVGAEKAQAGEPARKPVDPSDPAARWGTNSVHPAQAAAQPAPPAATGPRWGAPGSALGSAATAHAVSPAPARPNAAPSSLEPRP